MNDSPAPQSVRKLIEDLTNKGIEEVNGRQEARAEQTVEYLGKIGIDAIENSWEDLCLKAVDSLEQLGIIAVGHDLGHDHRSRRDDSCCLYTLPGRLRLAAAQHCCGRRYFC